MHVSMYIDSAYVYIHICIGICVYMCIYIYIYIYMIYQMSANDKYMTACEAIKDSAIKDTPGNNPRNCRKGFGSRIEKHKPNRIGSINSKHIVNHESNRSESANFNDHKSPIGCLCLIH